MESIQRKLPRAYLRCGLMLLGLTCLLGTADARPKLLPSEQFPGPWAEVTEEIREVLALNKVFACSRQWPVNRRATPATICCTAHRTRRFGQAGACNPRRTRFAAPASFSRKSHCRTAIKVASG